MTDKQPDPLHLADVLMRDVGSQLVNRKQAAALIRTQHTEIERLTSCIKWEQSRAERIGTHGPGCEKWGPAHYECALRAIERLNAAATDSNLILERAQATNLEMLAAIERKDALLRQCLKHVASNISMTSDGTEAEELYDAIQQEVVEQ